MAFFELQGLRLEGVRAFFQALLAVFSVQVSDFWGLTS